MLQSLCMAYIWQVTSETHVSELQIKICTVTLWKSKMLQLQRISKFTCCIVPHECLFENRFGSVGRLDIEAGLF